jgi:hypothetical protein
MAGVATLLAEHRCFKCAALARHYMFQPIAFETSGPTCQFADNLFSDLGHCCEMTSGNSEGTRAFLSASRCSAF